MMLNKDLETILAATARRLHMRHAMKAIVTAALAAGFAGIVVLSARVLWPLSWTVAIIAAMLAGGAVYWRYRPRGTSLFHAAQTADEKLGLDQRLATAVEWQPRRPEEHLVAAKLQADAARFAPIIKPTELVPYRLPRRSWLLIPLSILTVFLIVATPVIQWPGTDSLAADEGDSHVTAPPDDWQAAADRLKQLADMRDDDRLRQVAHMLDDLLARWHRGELSTAQFEKELAALENRLNAMLDTGPLSGSPTDASHGGNVPATDPGEVPGRLPDAAQPSGPQTDGRGPGDSDSAGSNSPGDNAAANETPSTGTGGPGPTAGDHGPLPEQDAETNAHPEQTPGEPTDKQVGESETDADTTEDQIADQDPSFPPGGSAPADDAVEDEGAGRPPQSDQSGHHQTVPTPGSPEDGNPGNEPGSEPGRADGDNDRDRPDTTGVQERAPSIVSSADATSRTLGSASIPGAAASPMPADAADAAVASAPESSVEQEHIPLAYRHWVRLYFEQAETDTAGDK